MIKYILITMLLLGSTVSSAEEQKVKKYKVSNSDVLEFTPEGNPDYICIVYNNRYVAMSCIPKLEWPITLEFED